ncbi:hypothetical protein ACH79_06490 [Bradyrhizobium sp. CCBAU 051011]|uniref:hypothetical protein n=1 Tax=Bradyrhizobium sp. CCBAU 051011 TaxID=858422 RepID=UPI00137452B7|nr:hypothetical protein [Bradyrhizobium sp. CCBAU 051011]QHO72327.1 hypothetical protein ACH79_06490 [Bradyrhizobium sp. CCBAU 051011]
MSENPSKRKSAISRLRDLFGQAQHPYRPSTQIFLDLDVDRVARDMRLAEMGAERGASGRPDTGATALDDVEHRIVENTESHKQTAHSIYQEHLHIYDARMTSLNFEERFAIIRQAAPEAVGDFGAEAAMGRDELFELRRRLNESEAEREDFRKRHRISRPARLPTPGKMLLKIGFLAVLFVLEVAVNGGFLSKSNQGGILGGLSVAFVFAAFNILVSYFCGLVPIRLINHRNLVLKVVGTCSLIGYLALVILLNLAIAHVREIPPDALVDVDREALRRLLETPLALHELQSWLLFGIGIVFSVASMADGLMTFDPYIGYTALERRWQAASEKYRNAKDELIERLRGIRDDAAEAMNNAERDLAVRRSEYDSLLNSRGRLSQRFVDHQAQIERATNALLQTYREANRKARSAPPPAHFDRPYTLDRIPIEQTGRDPEERERLRRSIDDVQALLALQVEAIHAAFDGAARSYREIDELFPESTNGKV